MKRLIAWLKKAREIVEHYDRDRMAIFHEVRAAERVIRDRTDIAVDIPVSRRDPCNVIVTGLYRGTDFVQTYSLAPQDMAEVIEHLKTMQRYGRVRVVDAPIAMRAVVKRELLKGGE